MHKDILNKRYLIKYLENKGKRPIELARPEVMKPQHWSSLALPMYGEKGEILWGFNRIIPKLSEP